MIGGNLSNCLEAWKSISCNKTVLDWLTYGVPLDFNVQPGQFEEQNNIFSHKETLFLDSEIPKLLQSGCIRETRVVPHCVSRISTVPKQDGSFRLITDLRQVNGCLSSKKSFIQENIDTVLELVEPGDKLITLDIKNGFFHIKVDPKFQTFLGFKYKEKYYVWCVLPFGLKHSPYYWGKVLRPVIQYLRRRGLRTVAYVDDFIVAEKPDLIEQSKYILIETLEALGYYINYIKSCLDPDYSAKYIGYIIHTNKGDETVWLYIPKERIKRVQADIKRALKSGLIVARALARIAGQIISMCKVLLPAKLLLRNVYRLLSNKRSWQDKLVIDSSTASDLTWWTQALSGWNRRAFKKAPQRVVQITTDASGKSWGGTIVGTDFKAQGYWDRETYNLSSNAKEMLAVLLTLKSLLHLVKNKTVQVLSDSVTTCAFINFQGGAIQSLDIIARNIWDLAIRNCINIQARHLAGKLNTEADRLSRLPAQYEWFIHPALFKYIDNIFGPHSIDRFGSILTHQLPRYNSLYWDPGTEGVDALFQTNWDLEVNFVNPPFRLLSKVINHIQTTQSEATVIAPFWPAKPWFNKLSQMAVHPPLKLPKPKQMCIPCLNSIPEPIKKQKWTLYAWRVSGKSV